MSYPLDRLRQEVAFIAYHFHWDHDSISEMAHPERHGWIHEINGIHESMAAQER